MTSPWAEEALFRHQPVPPLLFGTVTITCYAVSLCPPEGLGASPGPMTTPTSSLSGACHMPHVSCTLSQLIPVTEGKIQSNPLHRRWHRGLGQPQRRQMVHSAGFKQGTPDSTLLLLSSRGAVLMGRQQVGNNLYLSRAPPTPFFNPLR